MRQQDDARQEQEHKLRQRRERERADAQRAYERAERDGSESDADEHAAELARLQEEELAATRLQALHDPSVQNTRGGGVHSVLGLQVREPVLSASSWYVVLQLLSDQRLRSCVHSLMDGQRSGELQIFLVLRGELSAQLLQLFARRRRGG